MNEWNRVGAGLIAAGQTNFWKECMGNAELIARMLSDDPGYAARLVHFAERGCYPISTAPDEAERIMRDSYIGPNQWWLHDLSTRGQAFPWVPYSIEELEAARDTHILVCVPPVSIADLYSPDQSRFNKARLKPSHDNALYESKKSFATHRGVTQWRLIRTTPLKESLGLRYKDQCSLLGPRQVVVDARSLLFVMLAAHRVRKQLLFDDCLVRCAERDAPYHHIVTGNFSGTHTTIRSQHDNAENKRIGVAVGIAPQTL